MIVIADGRFDKFRYFRVHWTIRQIFDRLLDDASRLTHFFHAHQVAIVCVAVFTGWPDKTPLGMGSLGPGFATAPTPAAAAQSRAGKADRDRLFARNHSN